MLWKEWCDNLPSPSEVVDLYKATGIERMRIYDPNPQTLQSLSGSGIQLILDVPNPDLQAVAFDASAAANWVQMLEFIYLFLTWLTWLIIN